MRYCLDCRKVGSGVEKCKRISSGACRIVSRGFRAEPPNDTIALTEGAIIEDNETMSTPEALPGDAGSPLPAQNSVEVVNLAPKTEPEIPVQRTHCAACGHMFASGKFCGRELPMDACAAAQIAAVDAEAASMSTARWTPEMPVEPDPKPEAAGTRAGKFLRTAAGIVDGARNQTHGDKERSFQAIARLWTAYLTSRRYHTNGYVSAKDVAAMMVLMKFARAEWGEFVPDHAIDAAGYSAIYGELAEAQQKEDEDDF